MTQSPQQREDWGFFAATPRIVRVQYKQLTHTEKWLYVCLKDICGDKGMCFRTLRSLSEETNISLGSLSTMIPHLQAAGLIHAEKKRRSLTGKEIWHISIVDIWQANKEFCSNFEQSTQFVQQVNNDVQKMNENRLDCSKFEPDCSNFLDRRTTLEEQPIEEQQREEHVVVVSATASTTPLTSISPEGEDDVDETEKQPTVKPPSQNRSAVTVVGVSPPLPGTDAPKVTQAKSRENIPARPRPPKPAKPVAAKPTIAPEVQAVCDAWDSIFHAPIQWGPKSLEAAASLVKPCEIWCNRLQISRKELLNTIRVWIYKSDKKDFYEKERGGSVKIIDVAREFEGWQSAQQKMHKPPTNEHKTASVANENSDNLYQSYKALIAARQAQEAL